MTTISKSEAESRGLVRCSQSFRECESDALEKFLAARLKHDPKAVVVREGRYRFVYDSTFRNSPRGLPKQNSKGAKKYLMA